jgi:hypothetical protein
MPIAPRFDVTIAGKALDRWRVPSGATRYSWGFHLRRVARWRGMAWEAFSELDVDAQAAYIAEYETEQRISAVEYERQRPKRKRR